MANEKCFIWINLKTGCYIIGYFLLAVHFVITSLAVYLSMTLSMNLSMDDPNAMKTLVDVLLLGQFAFPIGISNIKFTIILLIGIHKNLRVFLRLYLIFATFMLAMNILCCFLLEFLLHKEISTSIAVLLNMVYAYFIYVIRKYWMHLNTANVKLIKQIV
ncbi:PREDICTED: uncharacterized protein LOC106101625 [Papilio polytes]|uniref:uncharacterized protein LOC106101625 n=1 Tax=Papilio polytes TaxID=76194 RepID=UPI000675FCF5|nr:PREDICTED: uncharacterized protein LOC106101625 [Papilio polytes]XP_013136374.1 PREDICTED: uncharacterized protein LOC106101625 [Papilio polytes]